MSFELVHKIGKGSYGNVFSCKFDNDTLYAVKILPYKEGIPSLVEASILSTFKHPYIMSTINIYTVENNLYLIQELAIQDMLTFIKRRNVPDNNLMNKWSFQMISAVACLHSNNIIHCDIKPNNIVVDINNDLKLIDFTFSVIKTEDNQTFRKSVGCQTYSAPEVLSMENWSDLIDIWSLGCTLYEIATCSSLIPEQNGEIDSPSYQKARILSCIYYWRKSLDDQIDDLKIIFYHCRSVVMSPNWDNLSIELKEIILSMTSYKILNRPTAEKLLLLPYFSCFNKVKYSIKKSVPSHIRDTEKNKCMDEFFNTISYTDSDVKKLSKDIYFRLEPSESRILDINTAFWIAHKILRDGKAPRKIFYQKNEIIRYEEKICDYLNYRLHTV